MKRRKPKWLWRRDRDIYRVKVSGTLVAKLHDWSHPVQMKIERVDGDGDLELIFRTVLVPPEDE